MMIKAVDLRKYFRRRGAVLGSAGETVRAVDGVSFHVEKGRTFGLVGESGCGKSTLARLVTGILRPDGGNIELGGDRDIVFQDPYSSLNPRMTVKEVIGESLLVRGAGRDVIDARVSEALSLVRLEEKDCDKRYPHQFSGGERQRIAIARALVRRPEIIVLDEPVSSLDVSIQAGILNLLKDLQDELSLTYLFISHDLRVVEFVSDTVGVMKDGRIVETAAREDIYRAPRHPYTRHLLECVSGKRF